MDENTTDPEVSAFCLFSRAESQQVVKCVRSRGRPKKTRTGIVEKDYRTQQLTKEDGMDCSKCRQLINDVHRVK